MLGQEDFTLILLIAQVSGLSQLLLEVAGLLLLLGLGILLAAVAAFLFFFAASALAVPAIRTLSLCRPLLISTASST